MKCFNKTELIKRLSKIVEEVEVKVTTASHLLDISHCLRDRKYEDDKLPENIHDYLQYITEDLIGKKTTVKMAKKSDSGIGRKNEIFFGAKEMFLLRDEGRAKVLVYMFNEMRILPLIYTIMHICPSTTSEQVDDLVKDDSFAEVVRQLGTKLDEVMMKIESGEVAPVNTNYYIFNEIKNGDNEAHFFSKLRSNRN